MRKLITVCSVVIVVFVLAIGWNLIKENKAKEDVSPTIKIGDATCAKFEYSRSKNNSLFITSEIKTLSNVFLSLDIVDSEKTVSDWIYRITFNCKELTLGEQEIVVLIGADAMSINGENYCTPENIPFESVVDIFDSKYEYFVDSMAIN